MGGKEVMGFGLIAIVTEIAQLKEFFLLYTSTKNGSMTLPVILNPAFTAFRMENVQGVSTLLS